MSWVAGFVAGACALGVGVLIGESEPRSIRHKRRHHRFVARYNGRNPGWQRRRLEREMLAFIREARETLQEMNSPKGPGPEINAEFIVPPNPANGRNPGWQRRRLEREMLAFIREARETLQEMNSPKGPGPEINAEFIVPPNPANAETSESEVPAPTHQCINCARFYSITDPDELVMPLCGRDNCFGNLKPLHANVKPTAEPDTPEAK